MRIPHIPPDWTAAQALEVAEFLDGLVSDIWATHGMQMQELLTARQRPPETDDDRAAEDWPF